MLDKAKNQGELKPYLRNQNVRWFDFDLTDVLEMRFLPEEAAKYTAIRGDVLICEGGYPGRAAIWEQDEPIYFQKALHRVRFHEPERSKWFLYYLLAKDLDGTLENHFNGAGIQHFTGEALAQFEVPLPPLPEQQRIVRILDEAFEHIALAKANAEKNLEDARAIFDRALDLAIQGEFKQRHPPHDSVEDLIAHVNALRTAGAKRRGGGRAASNQTQDQDEWPFRLPSPDWRWQRLDDLAVGISDGVHKKPSYVTHGIPFVSVKNLTAGPGISLEDLHYITPADHREFIKRTHPERGDILITKDGTIGVVRLIETDVEFSIFVSVALIKPAIKEIGRYLVYALRAPSVQDQIVRKGAALKHLYLVDLRRLAIPFPPKSVQDQIVARLDALATETLRLESVYQRKLAALDELKKSLLHEAFSGRL